MGLFHNQLKGVRVIATERSFLANAGGQIGSANSRLTSTVLSQFVVSANGTQTMIIPIPQGSWITNVSASVPVALTGSPTSALFRAGITSTGQELTADIDLKGQQNTTLTVPASFDRYGTQATSLFLQLVTSGGTTPVGTVNIAITIHAGN